MTNRPINVDEERTDDDIYDLGTEVTQSIAFTHSGALTLGQLKNIVTRAYHLGLDARVTIGLVPSDRPGAMSQTRITVTEQ